MTATWTGRKEAQAIYNGLWGSGFLPSKHQALVLRSSSDPVLFLSNSEGVSSKTRRRKTCCTLFRGPAWTRTQTSQSKGSASSEVQWD
jgi:hypothetical protein